MNPMNKPPKRDDIYLNIGKDMKDVNLFDDV